ncbi:MAG: hypothetical protein OQK82_08110, partial [Candidatus Pacearchaeota archaeon]|nr:hypothetical protein [Candidatus Pacearchaeota archaeon]
HAIVVDEAHNIFLKSSTNFVRESVTDMVYREMREYGTSLICIDQHVSKLSDTVKGNSACHIAFGQQLPADIYDIAGLMQLGDSRQFFSQLPVGSAIVKLSERHNFPFLIEVPKADIIDSVVEDNKVKSRAEAMVETIGLSKEEVKSIVKKEDALLSGVDAKPVEVKAHYDRVEVVSGVEEGKKSGVENAEEILFDFVKKKLSEGVSLSEIEDVLEKNRINGNYSSEVVASVINRVLSGEEKKGQSDYSNFDLSESESRFLDFLKNHNCEDYGIVDVYKILGLSARKGNDIKNSLIGKNLICVEEIRNDKGWKKIIRLCEEPIHIH